MEKLKYALEFDMKQVPINMLWRYISTENGLREWFSDDVEVKDKLYTFIWKNYSQQASVLSMRSQVYVRFHWLDDGKERTYFEMRIQQSDLTGNITLLITDFAEDETDQQEMTELWNQQINTLRRSLGV